MSDPKTLKELIEENTNLYGLDSLWWKQEKGKEKEFVFPERLRQEIIKWINLGGSFDKLIKEYMKDKNSYDLTDSDLEDFACDVLMHIFNLTEEDLK